MPETRSGKKTEGDVTRRTGEERGGVKESTTKVTGLASKLEKQAKEAAIERQKELQRTGKCILQKAALSQ